MINLRLRKFSRFEGSIFGCSMMFICQICQTVVPPRVAANRIPIEIRARRYPPRPDANPAYENPKAKMTESTRCNSGERDSGTRARKRKKDAFQADPGGTGYETVREILACADCAEPLKHNAAVPTTIK